MIEESGTKLSNVVVESHNSTQSLTHMANELENWLSKFTVKQ
jgi:methyl-accepting chemotaxis protein